MTRPRACHQPIVPTTCARCRVLAYWHVGEHLEKRFRTPAVLRWVADARATFELEATLEGADGDPVHEQRQQ